jgi:hypothetical protein
MDGIIPCRKHGEVVRVDNRDKAKPRGCGAHEVEDGLDVNGVHIVLVLVGREDVSVVVRVEKHSCKSRRDKNDRINVVRTSTTKSEAG